MSDKQMSKKDRVVIPAQLIPGFRTSIAVQNKVERRLLFRTWGGLGDQICAEPTLRYALSHFRDCEVSLSSERPELFRHLTFDKVFDEREAKPDFDKFLVFETITPPDDSNLVWQFFSHMLTNCVDFPSLCALRSQLPIKDKEILIKGKKPAISESDLGENPVFIHAGKHWPSKTFPKDWWDETLEEIYKRDLTPVLIGSDVDENRGTVDVDVSCCLDLRGELSVLETVWLLQRAKVLLTNDSSPLHMAASQDPYDLKTTGHCFINFIATCKHPDYIMHWRKGKWAFRETNLGLGGIWDLVSNCPNQDQKVTVDQIEENILRSWLPTPISVAEKMLSSHLAYWAQ